MKHASLTICSAFMAPDCNKYMKMYGHQTPHIKVILKSNFNANQFIFSIPDPHNEMAFV